MAEKSAGQRQGGAGGSNSESNAGTQRQNGQEGGVAEMVKAHPIAAGAAALAGAAAIAGLVNAMSGDDDKKGGAKKGGAQKSGAKKSAGTKSAGKSSTSTADTGARKSAAAKKSSTGTKSAASKSTASKSAGAKSTGAAKKSTAAKKSSGGNGAPRGGLAQPVQPDALLSEVVGKDAAPRSEITKRLWDYVKKNNLQDATNRRNINADERLRPIFKADQVTMFEMTKLVNQHLK